MSKKNKFGEWQLCPKCNGNGYTTAPWNYPVQSTTGTITVSNTVYSKTCDVCNGTKIIQRPIIK